LLKLGWEYSKEQGFFKIYLKIFFVVGT